MGSSHGPGGMFGMGSPHGPGGGFGMGSPHGPGGGFGMGSPHGPGLGFGMGSPHGPGGGFGMNHPGHMSGMDFSHGHDQDIADATPVHLSIPPSEHEARPGIEYGHGQDIAVSTPPQGTMLSSFAPHETLFSDMPSHGKLGGANFKILKTSGSVVLLRRTVSMLYGIFETDLESHIQKQESPALRNYCESILLDCSCGKIEL